VIKTKGREKKLTEKKTKRKKGKGIVQEIGEKRKGGERIQYKEKVNSSGEFNRRGKKGKMTRKIQKASVNEKKVRWWGGRRGRVKEVSVKTMRLGDRGVKGEKGKKGHGKGKAEVGEGSKKFSEL